MHLACRLTAAAAVVDDDDDDDVDDQALHLLRRRSAVTDADLEAQSTRRSSRLPPATGSGRELEVTVEVKADGMEQCSGSTSIWRRRL